MERTHIHKFYDGMGNLEANNNCCTPVLNSIYSSIHTHTYTQTNTTLTNTHTHTHTHTHRHTLKHRKETLTHTNMHNFKRHFLILVWIKINFSFNYYNKCLFFKCRGLNLKAYVFK